MISENMVPAPLPTSNTETQIVIVWNENDIHLIEEDIVEL